MFSDIKFLAEPISGEAVRESMENVKFVNVSDERIRKIFLKTLENFPEIHGKRIDLVRRKLKKTTMRAQPVLSTFFGSKDGRKYKIEFNNRLKLRERIKMTDLEDDVLMGWFAHELGHIIDYQRHGFLGMIKFGFMYLISRNFRIGCERQADLYAIEAGMAKFILSTKEFILETSHLPEKYKRRIRKYYLSADEVLLMVNGEEDEELKLDTVDIFNTDQ